MIINNEQNISMCFGVGIPKKFSTWSGNCVLILPSCYACHCIFVAIHYYVGYFCFDFFFRDISIYFSLLYCLESLDL